jgi:DNA repair protein SbcD/Mre11
MKFLYMQDAHCKGKNPSSRTDNYYESWLEKFDELLSIAKKKKADGIIDGGDLLDIPIVSNNIVDDILDRIEKLGIPFYTIFGNHPMIGHHRDTSDGTSLAHMLRRCKLMQEVKFLKDDNSIINLYEYYHNIEQDLKDNGIQIDTKENDIWKLAIVHAFITPKPFIKEVLHVVADEIKTNADVIIIAHYHEPWMKTIGKTSFIDIGCFGRASSAEADIKPSVCLIDTKKRTTEIIELKSAKAGTDVFDLTKKEHNNEIDEILETFISNLKDIKMQSLDLRGIIEMIGKEQNIERDVIDLILKRIGEIK